MDYQVLSSVLGDSVQVKLVEFFLINNTGMYQLTEIARILGISHSRVHDLIDSLVKMRIIKETRSKRNRLFELNQEHPISKQLSELYRITRAYLVASQF